MLIGKEVVGKRPTIKLTLSRSRIVCQNIEKPKIESNSQICKQKPNYFFKTSTKKTVSKTLLKNA